MARRARLAIRNLPHHIVQRGHNRCPVFRSDADRLAYLATLAEFREELGVQVHAWCLMSNHVHLVVNPGDSADNLGRLMKRLAGRHTRRMNRLEGRSGTAWEGRFKCSPIESSRYLLTCLRYVELNPVRAGMTADPADFRWSSYQARMGLEKPGCLDLDCSFLALGQTLEQQRATYRDWIAAGVSESDLALVRAALQRNQLTGSEAFAAAIQRQTGTPVINRGRGRPENKSVPFKAGRCGP